MAGKDVLIIGLLAIIVSLLGMMMMPKQVVAPVQPTPAVAVEQDECEARGGKWERRGDSGQLTCLPTTSDAGKPCNDRSQCESFCWAGEGPSASGKTSGTCYPWKYFTSCINSVNNGRTTAICTGGVKMIMITGVPK